MWRRCLFVVILLFGLAGCGRPLPDNTLIFDYADFGPDVIASALLGQGWWQWQPEGGNDPAQRYPIKVVVYWDVPLEQVKQAYPVVQEKQQDYRYVDRAAAVVFLNQAIDEAKEFNFGSADLPKLLQSTRHRIQSVDK